MEEQETLRLSEGKGVEGDHQFGGGRHLTLIFEDDWNAAARDVGREVDPAGRRANVLLSGGNGVRYLDTRLRLGATVVEIKGITDPCAIMNRAAEGMREALVPDGRAGIWGQIVAGGEIRLGDDLRTD